jgi:hypothetical protein
MDALALLREHEPELKKRIGDAKIGIFGSFVRGNAEEERPNDPPPETQWQCSISIRCIYPVFLKRGERSVRRIPSTCGTIWDESDGEGDREPRHGSRCRLPKKPAPIKVITDK